MVVDRRFEPERDKKTGKKKKVDSSMLFFFSLSLSLSLQPRRQLAITQSDLALLEMFPNEISPSRSVLVTSTNSFVGSKMKAY